MSTSDPAADSRPGLSNVIDIIVAPGSAFARLREVPTWGWAFLVASLLGIAGSLVVIPAISHAMDLTLPAQFAASPAVAKLPPDQQQSMIAMQLKVAHIFTQLSWLLVPIAILLAALIQALVMLLVNAATHGDGNFKKFFALSITIAVVGEGLRSVVLAIIVAVRGVNSFDTLAAVQSSLPSLALLAPGARGALSGFLGAINIFYMWATALLALGMNRVARIPAGAAWAAAIVMLLGTAAFAAAGAAMNR